MGSAGIGTVPFGSRPNAPGFNPLTHGSMKTTPEDFINPDMSPEEVQKVIDRWDGGHFGEWNPWRGTMNALGPHGPLRDYGGNIIRAGTPGQEDNPSAVEAPGSATYSGPSLYHEPGGGPTPGTNEDMFRKQNRPAREIRQPGWVKPGSAPSTAITPPTGATPSTMPAAPAAAMAAPPPVTGDVFGTMGRTAAHSASTGGNALSGVAGAMAGGSPAPLIPNLPGAKKQMAGVMSNPM